MNIQRHSTELFLFLILLSLLFTQSSFAAVYRCTDETGRKIFSDKPCLQGTKPVGSTRGIKASASAQNAVESTVSTERSTSAALPEGVVPVSITGRVTLASGAPIANVEVLSWGLKDNKTGFKGMETTRTDSNGNYTLNIDSRFLWVVYHHGTERREFSRKGPWQGDTTIDFVVPDK